MFLGPPVLRKVGSILLGVFWLALGIELRGAELVNFESAAFTHTPSPFKVKQAQKLGFELEVVTEPSVPLSGFLTKPAGDGPFPVVVLLHGCGGIGLWNQAWTKRFKKWGYVVLDIDSFKPRGVLTVCDGRSSVTPWSRALDAYGAKNYLLTLPFVDSTRIVIMGMSHGGWAVLHAINRSTAEGLQTKPFRAAVAMYPICGTPEQTVTPTLILIGEKDDWTPASECTRYVDELEDPHEVTLRIFEGAHHVFDVEGMDIDQLGNTLRYHPGAAAEAIRMTNEFLGKWLQ